MSNANVSRLGQINGSGDAKALFLKVYGGEVLTAFRKSTVTDGRHMVRNIASGKSAQFPVTGKKSARYHTPGAEILGTSMNHAERIITIDDLLIADSFIANIDEAMNHYDVRSIYSQEDGEALALAYDKHVLQVGINAAKASATVAGGNGGSTLAADNMKTSAAVLASAFYSAAQTFDEKDVPDTERYAYVLPAQYYMLAQTPDVINKDWGGEGSYAEGTVKMIANIPILKTNNLPTTNITSDFKAEYNGDFTKTAALFMHKAAVGTVKLMDLAVESEYDIRRQGTLMVSKYALGHGILRPECAIVAEYITTP